MTDGYGDFAFYYDSLNVEAEYERRADFFHTLLKEGGVKDGILLDLACGTGAMSELFAEKGFDVIGVDSSESMLSVANEKKLQSGHDILYLCQSMQELDLFGTVDCCVCALDGINHLTSEADVRLAFRNVALFMRPGGVFVFDVNTPYKHEKVLGNNSFVYDLDDLFCVWQNTFSAEDNTTQITLDVFEKDSEGEADDVYYRTRESFYERAYPTDLLVSFLNGTGFEKVKIFSEFSADPPEENSERIVISAVRSDILPQDLPPVE